MDDLREAAQQALEALEWREYDETITTEERKALASLRAALEQPEQEWLTGCPRCGMDDGCDCEEGTYNPPRREWQSLTDDEVDGCDQRSHGNTAWTKKKAFVRAIEQALKEKNHG
jgi:hypothetical protein